MPDSICCSTRSPRPAATLRIAALSGEAPRISTWSALSVSLAPVGPYHAHVRERATSNVQSLGRMAVFFHQPHPHYPRAKLTLRDHGDPGRVPPRLSLPALDTHRAKTDNGDRAVAVTELDAGPDFRCRSLDAHGRVDPLLSRQREVEGRPDRRRVLTRVRRIRCVALAVSAWRVRFDYSQRLPRPRRPSGTRLARIRPACTNRSALYQHDNPQSPL